MSTGRSRSLIRYHAKLSFCLLDLGYLICSRPKILSPRLISGKQLGRGHLSLPLSPSFSLSFALSAGSHFGCSFRPCWLHTRSDPLCRFSEALILRPQCCQTGDRHLIKRESLSCFAPSCLQSCGPPTHWVTGYLRRQLFFSCISSSNGGVQWIWIDYPRGVLFFYFFIFYFFEWSCCLGSITWKKKLLPDELYLMFHTLGSSEVGDSHKVCKILTQGVQLFVASFNWL